VGQKIHAEYGLALQYKRPKAYAHGQLDRTKQYDLQIHTVKEDAILVGGTKI